MKFHRLRGHPAPFHFTGRQAEGNRNVIAALAVGSGLDKPHVARVIVLHNRIHD